MDIFESAVVKIDGDYVGKDYDEVVSEPENNYQSEIEPDIKWE